jgi:hypothetical protein
VGSRYRADYRQTHTGAAPVPPALETVEGLGQQLDAFVGYARSGVGDAERHTVTARSDPHLGEAPAAVVCDGVLHQVEDELLEQATVATDDAVLGFHPHVHVACGGLRLHARDDGASDLG